MATTPTARWRPNWLGWGILLALCVIFGVGLPAFHNFQSQRIVERIRSRAEQAEKRLAEADASGRNEEAGKALNDVVKNYDLYLRHCPGDTDVQIKLALAVAKQADRARGNVQLQWNAYRSLIRALAKAPNNPKLLEAIGTVTMRLQQWEEAASFWRELWVSDERRTSAGVNLAKCQIVQEKIKEAIETLRQVVERNPSLLEAFVLLARCYRNSAVRDYESARAVIDEMVARNEGSAEAHAQRAAFWWWVSNTTTNPAEAAQTLDLAKQDVAIALEKSPRQLEALLLSAEIALHESDPEKAREFLLPAEEQAPNDRRVWVACVNWARMAADTKKEEYYLKRLAQADPSYLSELAELYLSQRPPDLVAMRQVILQMQRAHFPPQHLQFWQARLAFFQGEHTKAIKSLESLNQSIIRDRDPLKEWVGLALAEAYLQSGMQDSAGAILSQLWETLPDSPRVRIAWAKWLIQTGQADTAFHEFQRALESAGSSRLLSSGDFLRHYFLAKIAVTRSKSLDSPDWQQVEQTLQQIEKSPAIPHDDKIILRSRYLEARGQTAEAIKLLQEAIEEKATLALRLELASLLVRHTQLAEALAILRAARERDQCGSELLRAMLALAERLDQEAQQEIIAEVKQGIEQCPAEEKKSVLRSLARFYLNTGDSSQAQALWQELARGDLTDVESRCVLMELACQQQDFAVAKKWLEEIQRIEGSSGRTVLFGSALLKVCQSTQKSISRAEQAELLSQAKQELAVLEKRVPYWPAALRLKARIALLEGRLATAIDQYRTLARRGLLMRDGKEEFARILLLRGQSEEAEEILADLPLRAGDLQAAKLRAEVLLREGRISEAQALVKSLIEASADPLDWLWYAQFMSRAKQIDQADRAFARLLSLSPNWPEAYLAQLMHLVATNRKDEAEKFLQDWQKRSPQDLTNRRVIAIGLELLGQSEQAEKIYRQIILENPGNGDLLLEWAGFCLRQGWTSECRAVLERLVSDEEGKLQISDSTRVDARRNLAQLLGFSPDYREVCRAMELLTTNLKETGLPTDRCLLARILARRPERSSKQRAVSEYQAVLRDGGILSPEDRFAYAQALTSLGNWPDARLQMLELVNRGSPQDSHLIFFIDQLIKNKSPSEEIQPFLAKLQSMPRHDFTALQLQTRLLVREGREEEALSAWDKKLENAIRSNRYSEAEAILNSAEGCGLITWAELGWTRLAETRKEALLGQALFLGGEKRMREALLLCEKATESLPVGMVASTAMTILRMNRSALEERDLQLVEKWLNAAKESAPNNKRLAIDYASYLNLAGRYEEVERAYRQLLARNDLSDMEKALIQNNLAYVLAAAMETASTAASPARLQEAEDLIEKAIAILGPIGSFLDTRCVVRLALKKNQEALRDAQQAVLEDSSPLSYFHLVMALIAVGDTPTALREWQRARRDFGLSPQAIPPIERPKFQRIVEILER
ncbi:MAG: tetratricopeptide repeat protein [Thermogutta sp.]